MATAKEKLGNLLVRLRQAALGSCQAADHDLLQRFVVSNDEAAFALLVKRYGPMVLGLCLRILRQRQDAEDVFQAVFLVLARKAGTIRQRESLPGWLHRVAYRTAMKLRATIARRHARNLPFLDVHEPGRCEDLTLGETERILEEELERLADKYRAPILLCCLQGRTRDEAARQLGWKLGVLRGRLDRGRELLRSRLARRGIALSSILLPLVVAANSEASVLSALLSSTVRAEMGAVHVPVAAGVSAQAAALAQGVIQAMFLAKIKMVVTGVVILGLLGTGAGVLTYRADAQAPAANPFVQNVPAADPTAKPPIPLDRPVKDMDRAQLLREIERLRLELEQARALLKMANQEILDLRAQKERAIREKEKNFGGAGGGGAGLVPVDPNPQALGDLVKKKGNLSIYAPDQKTVAVAHGKVISLLDVATGKEIRRFLGHMSTVNAVTFSPDGKRLASGGKDQVIVLWDLPTGKIFAKTALQDSIVAVTFSPDGRLLLIRQSGQTSEIEVPSGKLIRIQRDNEAK